MFLYDVLFSLSFWWLGAFFVGFVALSMLSEFEKIGIATTAVAATFIAANWLGPFDIWKFITTEPWEFSKEILFWVGAGVGWAAFKWVLYVRDRKKEYKRLKLKFTSNLSDYLDSYPSCYDSGEDDYRRDDRGSKLKKGQYEIIKFGMADNCPAAYKEVYKHYLNGCGYLGNDNSKITPQIRNHIDDFYNWVIFWPFSMFSTFFSRFLDNLYHLLKGLMQRISDAVYGNLKNDLT